MGQNKLLFAVMTCQPKPLNTIPMPNRVLVDHTKRLPYIRETWAAGLSDYKFFFGDPVKSGLSDEVYLDCGDSYFETALKVQAICRWALAHNYNSLFKTDDDTYCRPERVRTAGFESYDFVGRLLPPEPNHPVPYPMGGCGYYLSERMMELAANDKFPVADPEGDPLNTYEDGWIGRVARDAGLELKDDHRLKLLRYVNAEYEGYDWRTESPKKSNDRISVCEFPCEYMQLAHNNWLEGQ